MSQGNPQFCSLECIDLFFDMELKDAEMRRAIKANALNLCAFCLGSLGAPYCESSIDIAQSSLNREIEV